MTCTAYNHKHKDKIQNCVVGFFFLFFFSHNNEEEMKQASNYGFLYFKNPPVHFIKNCIVYL